MATDPASNLIELLTSSAPAAEAGGELEQAAKLVPDRSATAVSDVRQSELLARFQQQRADGAIEVAVVDQLFSLVRDLLALKGWVV